jgi:uncharacterized membrane protein (DUF4010 family)
MGDSNPIWPYVPTFAKLALALSLGLFVGLERERRGKEAGLRTFGFSAVLGSVGGLLGEPYSVLAIIFVILLALILNVHSMRTNQGTELTTAAALVLVVFAGLLTGMGHRFVPSALAVVTAALLAWKEPLAGFGKGLTETEVRSAILLAILAFVVYPALPEGPIDRWGLVDPRAAWMTVMLIAAIGFVNYVLLKMYGARGFELTGFLGGLVNSTVTVTELAQRDRESHGELGRIAHRGVVLATTAMIVRNAVILAILSPVAIISSILPFFLMIGVNVVSFLRSPSAGLDAPKLKLESPFAIKAAFRFGVIFLALQLGGTFAERLLGKGGFYLVSVVGGLVSSASAVASAAILCSRHQLSPEIAATGAVVASIASAIVNLPLVSRVSHDAQLTRRLAIPIGAVAVFGVLGIVVQRTLDVHFDLEVALSEVIRKALATPND